MWCVHTRLGYCTRRPVGITHNENAHVLLQLQSHCKFDVHCFISNQARRQGEGSVIEVSGVDMVFKRADQKKKNKLTLNKIGKTAEPNT